MSKLFKISALLSFLYFIPQALALNIVTSNYPAYDLISHIVDDSSSVKVLLKPGADAHSFEPSPRDIATIETSDLFVYTGGENDEWISRILKSMSHDINTISMLDCVEPLRENLAFEHTAEEHHAHEGHDHDEIAFDEHVWTSPKNDILLLKAMTAKLSQLDPENKAKFEKNADAYIQRFMALDKAFTEIIQGSKRQSIIVADRFPFLYFVHDYKLNYYAAFSGCAEDTEASARTIATLINKVEELNLPYVICQENSSEKLAKTIASETNTEVLTLNACHNLTLEQYREKVEMITLLEQNLQVLKKALN